MSIEQVNFDEARQSQLPAVALLLQLGYQYLSRQQALELRGGHENRYLLTDVLKRSLMRINNYEYEGEQRQFSESDIDMIADELENYEFNGIIDTSREISAKIMPKLGGSSIEVSVGGRRESRSIRYFDFDNIDNNEFHVTVEYKLSARGNIRCDIVCFVNGIPLILIENKKSGEGHQKAIYQLRRYQENDFAPKLFIYTQLLLAMDGEHAVYGTAGTPEKFFVAWREKDKSDDELAAEIQKTFRRSIDAESMKQLSADLNCAGPIKQPDAERAIKEQDRAIYGLLRHDRVLDFIKNFVFYDGAQKKVARYQQYFAVNKMLRQVEQIRDGRRQGGVIWHTQGSGKSLTMVMFVRALIEDENIKNPRVLIVTDRIDLDKQIKKTFSNAGLKKDVERMKSGRDLLEHLKNKSPSVLTTLVHKFESAGDKRGSFYDDDPNIFVLIDEVHRSQGGEANMEMLKCLPKACVIGFTGTPLLKKDKTRKQFGEFIDQYTIDDALNDGIVLPLIYEGRYVDLYQDETQVDRWAERAGERMENRAIYRARQKITRKTLATNPARIEEICADVEKHFSKYFQGSGLKAQLVAPSKYAGLLMQQYFERRGTINTALVISDENGEISNEDSKRQEIVTYLQTIKNNYFSLKSYEEQMIDDFVNNPDGVEIVIVVDKLLTGFDAPCNTVLYLAKELRDHNLLQAIARVNRLHENPTAPKTAGYIIDYSENAVNISTAMDLFSRFDPDDVKRTLVSIDDKIHELGQSYAEVCDLFRDMADDHTMIESLRSEPERKKFVEKYNRFMTVYGECVTLRDFVDKIDHEKLRLYKVGLKKFAEIKKTSALQFGDQIDLVQYQRDLEKIMDKYVSAQQAEVLTEQIEITNRELLKQAIDKMDSPKAKAEAIAAQTNRVINEYKKQDEALYMKFSQQLSDIIEAMKAGKLADIEALKQLRLVAEEAERRQDNSLPSAIANQRGADVLYRNARQTLGVDDETLYQQIILELTEVACQTATVDWWRSYESRRQMLERIDDYIYDELKQKRGFDLSNDQIKSMAEDITTIIENNHSLYGQL